MRGSIRSRERCPSCWPQAEWVEQDLGRGRRSLVCSGCGRHAQQPEIRLYWDGREITITRDDSGRRFSHYLEAERTLGHLRSLIEQEKLKPELWRAQKRREFLWENYLEGYLDREARRLLPDQRASLEKKRALVRHMTLLNGRSIREITAGHLQDLATAPCLHLALAPKTRKDLISELGRVLRQAAARGDIERIPELPKVEVPRRQVDYMTPDQQTLALAHVPSPHRPILEFLMENGCRIGEACGLCWDQVHPSRGEFIIARTIGRHRELQTATKERKDNALPILERFQAYLDRTPRGIGEVPVFQNMDADPRRNPKRFYLPDFVRSIWREALQEADLPYIPPKNATRHSLGMHLRDEGWDAHLLARQLGHSSTQHTMRYYVQDSVSRLRALRESSQTTAHQTEKAKPGNK